MTNNYITIGDLNKYLKNLFDDEFRQILHLKYDLIVTGGVEIWIK